MSDTNALMNLSGAMDLIKKSSNPLTPIFEAITNSLESLTQRASDDDYSITVMLFYKKLTTDERQIEQISFSDNGSGFNEENYRRFREFFDKSKGFHNRGTGRLQYLHAFDQIVVDSVYEENGEKLNRKLLCNNSNFIAEESCGGVSDGAGIKTTVYLKQFRGNESDANYYAGLSIDDLITSIKRHFILRFYLDSQKEELKVPTITVKYVVAGEEESERVILPDNIPQPEKTGSISVPYHKILDANANRAEWQTLSDKSETIHWAHFSIPEEESIRNGIFLCSKDVPVQSVKFDEIGKDDSFDGKRYITAFYGELLDNPDSVNHSVDRFTLPNRKEKEQLFNSKDLFFDVSSEYLFIESIEDEVYKSIPGIYRGIIDSQEKHQENVAAIAKAHGIPLDVAFSAKIKLNDDEKTITKKLYKAQSEKLADKGYKAKKIHDTLNQLNPTEEGYQDDLRSKVTELSDLVDSQNKEELSKYVIRREMVKDVLKKILDQELIYQKTPVPKGKSKDKEGLIHDLIFKRKKQNQLNDLWILDEEFLHFEGCSDVDLDQIALPDGRLLLNEVDPELKSTFGVSLKKRPDIYLFASEGKCLIIEFKSPNVEITDHINQMTKYCTLIANYGVVKTTKFYCYLVGEKFNPHINLDGDYYETVNGDWVRDEKRIMSISNHREPIAFQRLELVQLSSIHERAHRRNMSFAEQLGLPELLAGLDPLGE
ncbi:type I restriction enzyme HsdR N-terminal domain-containing protein [Pseudoteredinibacter isoporae]|uniref:Histidine kinase/DNA gyrase B/HSP90-like ATPase n=1 Tax=Pseudoteredinibacter isoporae TaxID=570281 RepID=A0A7X0JST4_9GAMM|nr:type I restriction enzyme HsdR N-terminal domain-containing protein [Pseudoteredinibacter isoporae]MBB6521048.1 hypothetical protein [Pseudoteredinibacter isoporae]NHO86612.1 type I restriction enzyme HsdR N-terminal domain-containing protein [Pseudoteredinibacter isoporae]NIB24936.1 type I restriction enzyme HsdR N-terminal domain-containing protein [Pseudoteredinibacter isoporae]